MLGDEQWSKGWPFSILNDQINEQLVGGASHQPAETSNRHPTLTTFLQELKMAVVAKVEEEVAMIATPVESQKLRCVLVVDGNRYSPEDYPPTRKHIHT